MVILTTFDADSLLSKLPTYVQMGVGLRLYNAGYSRIQLQLLLFWDFNTMNLMVLHSAQVICTPYKYTSTTNLHRRMVQTNACCEKSNLYKTITLQLRSRLTTLVPDMIENLVLFFFATSGLSAPTTDAGSNDCYPTKELKTAKYDDLRFDDGGFNPIPPHYYGLSYTAFQVDQYDGWFPPTSGNQTAVAYGGSGNFSVPNSYCFTLFHLPHYR